jgi:hypothetical protein
MDWADRTKHEGLVAFGDGTKIRGPERGCPLSVPTDFLLLAGLAAERSYCLILIVQYVKDRIQFGDLQHVVNLLGEA